MRLGQLEPLELPELLLLLPLVPWAMLAVALWRWLLGREPRAALGQRLGFAPRPAAGPTIWLHAASNGELASARWVLEDLLAGRVDLQVLVTTNTATAQAMASAWGLRGVTVAFAPLDRILIETDSPYLAPVPYRGKTNNPSYVPYVAQQVAQCKGLSVQEVAQATSRNFDTLFTGVVAGGVAC